MTKTSALIVVMTLATLVLISWHFAGAPAFPDGRLSSEPWRVLAVSPLESDRFLVSVRYAGGDIRTYSLHIGDQRQRDEFLKAQQALKKGKPMIGRAQRSRAGLEDDSDMGFGFSEAPETEPKAHSS